MHASLRTPPPSASPSGGPLDLAAVGNALPRSPSAPPLDDPVPQQTQQLQSPRAAASTVGLSVSSAPSLSTSRPDTPPASDQPSPPAASLPQQPPTVPPSTDAEANTTPIAESSSQKPATSTESPSAPPLEPEVPRYQNPGPVPVLPAPRHRVPYLGHPMQLHHPIVLQPVPALPRFR